MDDERCRQFFLEPTETAQRKYEALRVAAETVYLRNLWCR
jgi:hypothetical protein